MTEHTYREAGVDIDLEARAVRALIDNLTYQRTGSFPMMGAVGHFAGLIDCGPYALALAVDGVGTKMLVADALRNWRTVGIDCIAMNADLCDEPEPVGSSITSRRMPSRSRRWSRSAGD